jgi:microsomal epoxide hydrolase
MSDAIVPFRCEIPGDVLDDLRERLARTRFPDELNDDDWSYGTDLAYLRELCAYWRDKFDWRAQEAALNRFEQFKTKIDGLDLHFIHARSPHRDALPLVVTHGWPGSVFEFLEIIEPLRNPTASTGKMAGDAADAFHVVCPSIPGYGFSQAAREPGMHPRKVSGMIAQLMARLGYARYGAQGGDWGSMISQGLAVLDPEHCAGIHLNMVFAGPPQGASNPMEGLGPKELAALADAQRIQNEEMGYFRIQSTKPQTLGVGLNDSPAGLASWIVEKFRTWSDCDGDVESVYTKDRLLANITLYWVTQTITSSTRLYCEAHRAEGLGVPDHRVPLGCAIFPKELIRAPRSWVESHFDVRQWTEMPRGGHFAAMEQPELLVRDVRSFFRGLR